jgi:hypothetical protein
MGEPGQSPAPSPLLRCAELLGGGEGGGPGLAWGFWEGKGGFSGKPIPRVEVVPNSGELNSAG